ncbi:BON domain-containing protein [Paraburkholderia silvatlantica]|uniref:Osmotically-inducible protein OsmY n=1 Tax=Paraburkholderia silvatlantica TaxID=321895 RepID=A0ABR6FG71_9BURK|nr:BON domain-containing protein [Paraburkholderia silvatlantica]MBB2926419.1 osmotically-inducible protein OsmY [Paraburkholderia silvatlantica]PVY25014.1 BON domain-containing protein [Paraburkholderia silvatlantica]PXW30098.1 BON domain-containing protein [Paraburkholderia silvatlantica]TDQ81837.1 BON domain-containing protein [Paraburkholderia silvatlantica]
MKRTTVVGLAIAMLAAASMSAWAQPQSDAGASAGAQAASGAAAPTGRQTDRALRRKVYSAIGKDKSINAGNISVRAKSGAVTLTGTVSDPAQVGKVEEIAKGVPGVTSVTNKLTVQKSLGGM